MARVKEVDNCSQAEKRRLMGALSGLQQFVISSNLYAQGEWVVQAFNEAAEKHVGLQNVIDSSPDRIKSMAALSR